ncbi:hypothetical protein [Bradyrhizobium sp. Leo121]|uniref:hypothetical protein n=1 Tax=Bradyrhizobium sp. Leo121 TaxID=1571195 RepID=UPI001029622C|nr:hypothetical protein [Bradyrhizobium sp. Leo121]RZN30483.1 hypothetical protein CWO90_20315 [Bradyrhizobium sp. Leo121]
MFKALDPSRFTGWAVWEATGPRSGVFNLNADSEPAIYSRAETLIGDFVQPGDIVGVEAPLLPAGMSIQSRQILLGVRAIIFVTIFKRQARVIEIEPARWRSKILGLTQAPKHIGQGLSKSKKTAVRRAWLKRRAIDEVAARGWGKTTDDQADALCILDYLRMRLDPAYVSSDHKLPGFAA